VLKTRACSGAEYAVALVVHRTSRNLLSVPIGRSHGCDLAGSRPFDPGIDKRRAGNQNQLQQCAERACESSSERMSNHVDWRDLPNTYPTRPGIVSRRNQSCASLVRSGPYIPRKPVHGIPPG
jgi:hypothetical protein